MAELKLLKMSIPRITIKNNLDDGAEVELTNNFTSNDLNFDADKKLFEITHRITISDKNDKFLADIQMRGSFQIEYDDTKEKGIKLDKWQENTFAILYPYIRATLTSIMADAMLTPIYLPPLKFEVTV